MLSKFTSQWLLLAMLFLSKRVQGIHGTELDVSPNFSDSVAWRRSDISDKHVPCREGRQCFRTNGVWVMDLVILHPRGQMRDPKCPTGTVEHCVMDLFHKVLSYWAQGIWYGGALYEAYPTKPGKRSLELSQKLEVGREYSFLVGGGSSATLEAHLDFLNGVNYTQSDSTRQYLEHVRAQEPHYLTVSNRGNNTFGVGWHVNETSTPGLNETITRNSDRDHDTITYGGWIFNLENKEGFHRFNKSPKHLKNMAVRIGNWLMRKRDRYGLSRNYCFSARAIHRKGVALVVNNGTFRFGTNHVFPRERYQNYDVCLHAAGK